MAKRLLRDIDPLAAAILDGDHDDILGVIIQAAQARQKQMYRPGTRVRFKNMTGKFAHLDGKEGEIEKVNTKSISVGYGKRDEFGYEHYVNASQDFLELV